MYYIWYFNNDDPSTFYYLTKGSDIEALWKMMMKFWGLCTGGFLDWEMRKAFYNAKVAKSGLLYGFYSFSPYSFLIEYIGD